ncbi:hypothetical protein NA57DRAFT_52142 [Rhizodiscina lignyota]|uniref:Uncharacterized protein n=1 Tax=Rhizodiscina lignyota TaxID=1504668 RepID=A0A9P4INN4_9PEZI|nr:hypothetical protein NA57DRAFT_52142 [Rhizodiscina lignyota]
MFLKAVFLAAVLLFSEGQAIRRSKCSCYTATTTISDTSCPTFTPPGGGICATPFCILDVFVTVPAHNPRCPKTPTVTSFYPCPTACPGCATGYSTETASTTCLSTSKPTSSAPPVTTPPPSSCYTATDRLRASDCTPIPDCFTADCIIESIVTVPPVDSNCPVTPTVTIQSACPTACVGDCQTDYSTVTAVEATPV